MARKGESVRYEWLIELLEESAAMEDSEIIDPLFYATAAEALAFAASIPAGEFFRLAVTRAVGSDADGLQDQQYAYVKKSGELPARFDAGAKVPDSLRNELSRARAKYPAAPVMR